MKYELNVEVRIMQPGSYGNALTLGDSYSLELNTLSDAALILVRVHELCQELLRKSQAQR